MPDTRQPRFFSSRAKAPGPQPMSSTRLPGGTASSAMVCEEVQSSLRS